MLTIQLLKKLQILLNTSGATPYLVIWILLLKRIQIELSDIGKVHHLYKAVFIKGWHPPHPTFFVRSEIYEKYGSFNTSFKVSADFELMLRFLEKYKISTYFLNETIIKMRYGGESTRSVKKIIIGNKNILKAFEKNGIKASPFYTICRFANKATQFLK